jgi:hypothetical protein
MAIGGRAIPDVAKSSSSRVIRPAAISTTRSCGSLFSNSTRTRAVPGGTMNSPSLGPSGVPSSVTCAPCGTVFTKSLVVGVGEVVTVGTGGRATGAAGAAGSASAASSGWSPRLSIANAIAKNTARRRMAASGKAGRIVRLSSDGMRLRPGICRGLPRLGHPTQGLCTFKPGNRLKSRSAVHSSLTPFVRQTAAIRAS